MACLGMKLVEDLQCCKIVELRMCWLFVAVLHVGAEARVGRGRRPIIGCHQPEVEG